MEFNTKAAKSYIDSGIGRVLKDQAIRVLKDKAIRRNLLADVAKTALDNQYLNPTDRGYEGDDEREIETKKNPQVKRRNI